MSRRQNIPPEMQLMRLANAFQLSRAVQVAARLGIGGLLRQGHCSATALATATGTNHRALRRLLRFLADLGVIAEQDDGQYGPTALSDRLHLIDNIAQGDESWAVWGALPHALQTGASVFAHVHGAPFYEYAADHPEQEANWIAWMSHVGGQLSRHHLHLLALTGSETVVDVGGGEGALLAAILAQYPNCNGILFDLPSVVARAPDVLRNAAVADRCRIVGGDALREIPTGGDMYVVSRVLQNLDDQRAQQLLERCREAMAPDSRLAVIETLMPPSGDSQRLALAGSDLNLFLLWGGGHRTQEEMNQLLQQARFAPHGAPRGASAGWQIIEARPL